MMPFGVSSFSSLIKGHGFILIAPPVLAEFVFSVGSCFAFVACVYLYIKAYKPLQPHLLMACVFLDMGH